MLTAPPQTGRNKTSSSQAIKKVPYLQEYVNNVDIAADPVVPYMSLDELRRMADRLRTEMAEAAKQMEFMEAARLRDELVKTEERIRELSE